MVMVELFVVLLFIYLGGQESVVSALVLPVVLGGSLRCL